MHRKKVFRWILVQTIFSSPRVHFLVFPIKFHTGVDWAPNFRNFKKKINTQQSVWRALPSQHNHRWPQLQCFEDNVLALLGRVRIEQDQGWRVRNTETTKSKFSARQINTNKDPRESLSPVWYLADPSKTKTCIQLLNIFLHSKQTTTNKSKTTSFVSLSLHYIDKSSLRINISMRPVPTILLRTINTLCMYQLDEPFPCINYFAIISPIYVPTWCTIHLYEVIYHNQI